MTAILGFLIGLMAGLFFGWLITVSLQRQLGVLDE